MPRKISGLRPIAYPGARILILGSMPGERSLQMQQYYAHPRNQFWKILAEVFGAKELKSYSQKKKFLKVHRIALWDVVKSCHRHRSADLSIRKVQINDLDGLLERFPGIHYIFLNGRTAQQYFLRNFARKIPLSNAYLPSTSPAHAGRDLKTKLRFWRRAFVGSGILKPAGDL